MCEEVAYPFASVSARIGRHIVSLATLMKLSALRHGVGRHALRCSRTRKLSRPKTIHLQSFR